jgi:autotransporter-associated beta strand protein
MNLRSRLALATLLWAGFSASSFAATTYIWSSSGSAAVNGGYFNVSANWVGDSVPPSSPTNTALEFSASPRSVILLSSDFDAFSLTFNGSYPAYYFLSDPQSEVGPGFRIGSGGITVGAGSNPITFSMPLTLLASQTWNVTGDLVVLPAPSNPFGPSITAGAGIALTKSGTGSLTLYGFNSFSGGVDVTAGTLFLGNSSFFEGQTFGPVGSGTLTLRTGTKLASVDDAELNNAIIVQTGVTFGDASNPKSLVLTGAVTLQAPSTALTLGSGTYTQFDGNIGQTSTTSLTFNGAGLAVLGGTNSYTGGTTADGAGVVFGSTGSVPTTGSISAINSGYVGSRSQTIFNSVVGKITNPTGFTGSLGLETQPFTSTSTFTNIDLSGFSPTNFKGLGSFTDANVTGTLSPVGGTGDYKFGGGYGTLFVTSALAASGTSGVNVSSPNSYTGDQRFLVYLRGANTFTGGVTVSHGNLIFDAASALPANVTMTLGAHGYAGYSGTATNVANFEAFRSRVTSYTATSVIGLDSATRTSPRTVSDAINLSTNSPVYVGTASSVNLTGTITPPTGGTLFLTGVNDGYLKIGSALTTANGVSALKVGYASSSPAFGYLGWVELDSAASNYTGDTTLASGYLLLGASSNKPSTFIVNGPIGTGTLIVPADAHSPALSVTTNAAVLHNNISLLGPTLTLGLPSDRNQPTNVDLSFTLAGVISGPGSLAHYTPVDSTLTLSGANTFSGGFTGNFFSHIIATNNSAFGTGMLSLDETFVEFTGGATAPVIGGLSGTFGSITLLPSSSLTINQQAAGEYSGSIDGNNVTITKTGAATLTLSGESSYTGTTNINQGTVVATGGSVFGTSTISLGGGNLTVESGATLNNTLVFTAPTRLSGDGAFSAPLTVGSNVTLAPGLSPGMMSFANLTFGPGGSYEIEVQSAAGPAGSGYDTLSISGSLAFTSTSGSPFQLNLVSLLPNGSPGAVSDFLALNNYSWTIATATGGITGFSQSVVTVNYTGFTNGLSGGQFSVSTVGNDLKLNFTAVPEPSTWALLVTGLAGVMISVVRRRSSRR